MRKMVFLYKDNSDNRDCVKYISNIPPSFELDHYFAGVGLNGACFCTSFASEAPIYENIVTILTAEQFKRLIQFDKDIAALGYNIKKGDNKYNAGIALISGIQDILDKLNSPKNENLFAKVVTEEFESIMNEYELNEDDVEEIFDNYELDYRDRGVVSCVWDSIEKCAEEEAFELGYADSEISEWFDFNKFGRDLLRQDNYLKLSNGCVIHLNY
jgi:hypothetical protein